MLAGESIESELYIDIMHQAVLNLDERLFQSL